MVARGPLSVAEQATYTFLFTDVEGSTRRWEVDADAMRALLADHDRTLQAAVELYRGTLFKHTGDGICAVFASVAEAVSAAVDAQRGLELPVRMAVHTGEAIQRDGDFFGVTLSRCARLMEVGHGGQVLVSATSALMASRFVDGIELRELGEYRLRDLSEPERIFQVLAPGLTGEFPRLRSLDVVRHNLPVLGSSFIGRELELIDVCERLGGAQLLTLTGIGGCGKTRLALGAAGQLLERFPQGVFFVDLAVLSDPELLRQAVASALELHLVDPDVVSLAAHLHDRGVLIVLDNCEHVLDACAELVEELLARCPALRILATSREPLGIDGEQVFRVPSLAIETDAVRLFVNRARAAGADIDAEVQERETIVDICRRLDGIPLAIELAAARTTHLAPAEILERLADRFRLLTGGRRRVQRQQTLAGALNWSHDLLSDSERTLFRRLAVFRGSFSLRAVEEICHPDALDVVGSLVAKSLVNTQQDDGATRYRLLETVRLYAEERLLESGEAAELRSSHRDWLLAWLESLPVGQLVELGGGDLLLREADNLAGALEWSLEQGRLDFVVRLASRMLGYWWSYVRVAELARWWEVLEESLTLLPSELQGPALLVGVQHALARGDFEEMEELSDHTLRVTLPDSWVAAYAWAIQALYWTYADPERGRRCIDEGRKAAKAADVPELERLSTIYLANLLTGDPEQDEKLGGRELLDRVVARIEDAGDAQTALIITIVAALGDTATASRLAASASARSTLQRFSHQFLAAVLAMSEDRNEAAAQHLRELAALVREYAIPLGELTCVTGFAALAARAGDYQTASRHLASVRAAAPFPARSPADALVYRQTALMLRDALDPTTAARCRAEGAATPVSKALDTELAHPHARAGTDGRCCST